MLRFGFILTLYIFLFIVARVAWRELRAASPDAGPSIELVIIDPARSRWRQGQRVRIRPGATVGRAEGNVVMIDEDTVSAQHAVIHHEQGRWWVEDLGSTNGTFINRRPLTGRAEVTDGDEVMFGRVALGFGAPRKDASSAAGRTG